MDKDVKDCGNGDEGLVFERSGVYSNEVNVVVDSFYERLEGYKVDISKKYVFDRLFRETICNILNRDGELNLKK